VEVEPSRIEVLERLTSDPSRLCGMEDLFSLGYLGFALGPDQRTLYYLTGGPIYRDGERVAGLGSIAKGAARGEENLHLVTYDIRSGERKDHGPVVYEDGSAPSYVNSIAVGQDGSVYSLGRVTDTAGRTRTDLFRVGSSQIEL
jgi:hypothetical protein